MNEYPERLNDIECCSYLTNSQMQGWTYFASAHPCYYTSNLEICYLYRRIYFTGFPSGFCKLDYS